MSDSETFVAQLWPALSALAAIVSALCAFLSWQSSRKSKAAEDKALEHSGSIARAQQALVSLEKKREEETESQKSKAVLTATLAPDRGDSAKLWITNTGQADARELEILLDGVRFEQSGKGFAGTGAPQAVPAGNSPVVVQLFQVPSGQNLHVELRWKDDWQDDGVWSNALWR